MYQNNFCTRVDHQSVTSNIKKDLHKINDVIDNDAIILRPLSFVQKIHKTKRVKNTVNSVINGNMMLKFCTEVAHDNTI